MPIFNAAYLEKRSMPIPECGCMIWLGALNETGYGLIRKGPHQGNMLAHRVAFSVWKADPTGQCVLHHCDVPACINPDHLYLGTRRDNVRDRHVRGRNSVGTSRPLAKLTDDDVRAIRADPRTGRAIAKDYGINHASVNRIKNRLLWKHVNG